LYHSTTATEHGIPLAVGGRRLGTIAYTVINADTSKETGIFQPAQSGFAGAPVA